MLDDCDVIEQNPLRTVLGYFVSVVILLLFWIALSPWLAVDVLRRRT